MAKRGGFPGGMPGNMNNLMKQAQRMQRQMEESQKELETKEFTAKAGGGAVEVTVTGKKEVVKVTISEEVYSFVDGSFNPATNVYGCGGFLVVGTEKYVAGESDFTAPTSPTPGKLTVRATLTSITVTN